MMESRIISIYAHEHDTEYWYDIDQCFQDTGYLLEAQECGGGVMNINVGDEIYILCRYKEGHCEFKYKCRVEQIHIPGNRLPVESRDDLYVHNDDGYVSQYYFNSKLVEEYEDGNFPLNKFRELGLVSNHNQLNGDKVNKAFIRYIEKNKRCKKLNGLH